MQRGVRTVRFAEAVRVWGYIGVNSFGGPAGQIAVMHRALVEKRRWLSERRFLHALNYCMVLPGPEAQQLATYVGWLMHGVRGGAVAGSLFVIPGFVVMMALSIVYAVYGDVGWVSGLLFGLQAAVVAIVAQAVIRVGDGPCVHPSLKVLAVLAFAALFVFGVPFPLVVLGAGLAGWGVGRGRPRWLASGGRAAKAAGVQGIPYVLPDDEAVAPSGRGRRAVPRWCVWCCGLRRSPRWWPLLGTEPCLHPGGAAVLQVGGHHLRRRLCRPVLHLRRSSRQVRVDHRR